MGTEEKIRKLNSRVRMLEHACKFAMATIKELGMLTASSRSPEASVEEVEERWREYSIPLLVERYDALCGLVGEEGLEEYQEMIWQEKEVRQAIEI